MNPGEQVRREVVGDADVDAALADPDPAGMPAALATRRALVAARRPAVADGG